MVYFKFSLYFIKLTNIMKIYQTNIMANYGRTKSCNLIGPFGIAKVMRKVDYNTRRSIAGGRGTSGHFSDFEA